MKGKWVKIEDSILGRGRQSEFDDGARESSDERNASEVNECV